MVIYFSPNKGIFNGIFAYVNKHYSSLTEMINIESSSTINYYYGYPKDIFPPQQTHHLVIESINASYTLTFKNFSINITSYSIKSSLNERRKLQEWKVEGSYMRGNWVEIHHVKDCVDCNINNERHYQVRQHNVYDSSRITKFLNNSDGRYFFDLHGFEVFGTTCNPLNCDLIKPFTCQVEKDSNIIIYICVLLLNTNK